MEELIRKIFECNKCNLSKTKEYYGGRGERDIMLVFQNPNVLSGPYSHKDKIWKEVKFWRKGFHEYWVKNKRQGDFFEWLFEVLDREKLIKTGNLRDYIDKKKYFDDFYVTDIVKCHGQIKDLDKNMKAFGTQPCYEFLKEEIKQINPKLILSFGKRTQDFFNELNPQSIMPKKEKFKNIVKIHGSLYKCENFYLIPSAHISRRGRNNYLRNSFFDYLGEGIKKYAEITGYYPT